MTAVEFQDVVKIYGKGEGQQIAVDHVSFTIEKHLHFNARYNLRDISRSKMRAFMGFSEHAWA